jgi:2-polyprenyl-6-methoxyphenol hydroxylase-like FAD-dependent oxidoreductase
MQHQVLIRGDGSVGRTLALALATQGLSVALLGRNAPRAHDVRAYALNSASQKLLARLKVWDGLPPDACTPVFDMRVQTGGRQLDFSAWNAQAQELAWIVDAAELDAQLDAALRFAPHVQRVQTEVPHELLALCEGREAAGREALGVTVQQRAYGHDALATRLVADLPHQGRAWQWFTEAGEVLALLPLNRPTPGRSYALVWSQPEALAAERLDLPVEAFEVLLNALTGQNLSLSGPRERWPLRLLRAQQMSGNGFVLLGDCAHVLHPLAGQGLNLGLADVAALADVLAGREAWRSLGDGKLLRRFERARSRDTFLMGELTDTLWAGLTQSPPWARRVAAEGLTLVNQLTPLKRWLSRQAMGRPSI